MATDPTNDPAFPDPSYAPDPRFQPVMSPPPAAPTSQASSQGAMGGLFAPIYTPGDKQSEANVAAWEAANRPITAANENQFREPFPAHQGPIPMSAGDGRYGGPIPLYQNYTDTRPGHGFLSPAVMLAASQGIKGQGFTMDDIRNAIAQRMLENQAL
jgi:hypothetical protein